MARFKRFPFIFTFAALMVSAFLVRYVAARHGLPYIYNYDEPVTAGAALHILTSGDFNPHQFNYGSLLIYLYTLIDVFDFFHLMGQPDTAVSYLTSLNDIHAGVVGGDREWLWTISHPSFYLWDRLTSVALGLLTIVLTYKLSRHVTGHRWAALVSVAVLSALPIVVEHSAYTTPDGPVSCFVVGAVLFACRFYAEGRFGDLFCSLVFAGLTAATKYNDGLVIVVPALALVLRHYRHPGAVGLWWFVVLPAVPATVFLVLVPYSLLDSVTFLSDVGFEVRHYNVLGHGENSSSPGLGQLLFQSRQFYEQLGFTDVVLAAVGVCSTAALPRLRLALVFPIVYVVYMLGVKVNFHRNYVPVYPFAALLVSAGAYNLCDLVARHLPSRAGGPFPTRRLAPAAVVLLLGVQVASSWAKAGHEVRDLDSRTRLIGAINGLAGDAALVVPEALRLHRQDLDRSRRPITIAAEADLGSCATMPASTLIVLPTAVAGDAEGERQAADEAMLRRLGGAALAMGVPLVRIDGSPLYLAGPTRSPGLIVVPVTPELCRAARPT